jgi:hypothetical protein
MQKGNEPMDKSKLLSLLQQIKALTEECLTSLEDSTTQQRGAKNRAVRLQEPKPKSIDFNKPIRPFIKQYAKGMSGPEKFVLLLSHIVKGDLKAEVGLKKIENQWNRMKSKSLLAMNFNRFFAARAKENDWVDSKKIGIYNLRPDWKKIFKRSSG